ncbi:MAG: hypothetical protein IJC84_02740 [Clostridia bacterium]|nr:hypothetical protein [Clostridia bacterium]
MREIRYEFQRLGGYQTKDNTDFGDEKILKLIVEPHEFSLKLGDDTLRSSSCRGYVILASSNGEVNFQDLDGNELVWIPERDQSYRSVRLLWQEGRLLLQFGSYQTVDLYPHCDGESDRWETRWVSGRELSLDPETDSVTLVL